MRHYHITGPDYSLSNGGTPLREAISRSRKDCTMRESFPWGRGFIFRLDRRFEPHAWLRRIKANAAIDNDQDLKYTIPMRNR